MYKLGMYNLYLPKNTYIFGAFMLENLEVIVSAKVRYLLRLRLNILSLMSELSVLKFVFGGIMLCFSMSQDRLYNTSESTSAF